MPETSTSFRHEHVSLLLEKLNGLVEATVTTDGKHIVTLARLQEDLVKAVNAGEGRASSHELAASLGVDDSTVRAVTSSFWTKNHCGRCVDWGENMEIMTEAYLASLARETREMITKLGRVKLHHLASSLKLPIELTETLASEWMQGGPEPCSESASRWRVVNGALVGEIYEATKRAALNTECSTATEPRPVEELMQACNLHPEEEMMAIELLKKSTEAGQLEGSLTAAGSTLVYMPNSFVAAQHEAAHAFFSANGYLDHTTASDLQVRKLHTFVKDRHQNAVFLETVVVSRDIVEQLEAVADGAVAEASWFEAWTVVPTILSDADAAHLVGMCTACKLADGDPLGALHFGVYGVSNRFIRGILIRFRDEAASEIRASALSSGEHKSNEQQLVSSGNSSRKGRGKQRKKGSKKTEGDGDLMSDAEVQSVLRVYKPELDDSPHLLAVLGTYLAPMLREERAEAIRRAEEAKSVDSFHGRADAFEAAFERRYSAFQLHCRGVQALRQSLLEKGSVEGDARPDPGLDTYDGAARPASGGRPRAASDECSWEGRAEIYLLRTVGAQLAEMVTARECEKLGIPFASHDGGGGKQLEHRTPVITEEASSALEEVLPKDVATSLVHLWQAAMTGGQISAFCTTLEKQVFPACNLVGRRLDKRRERQLITERQRATRESLFQSVSEREVFHLATLLVFQNATGGFPFLPAPKLTPPEGGQDLQPSWTGVLLEAVRKDLSQETNQCLSNLQRLLETSETATPRAPVADESQGGGGNSSAIANDAKTEGSRSLPVEGVVKRDGSGDDTDTMKLLRSVEAVRRLGMACSD